MLKIYDTLARKEIELAELTGKTVNYYSCGPTVYGYAHIGNLRSFIMADILYRTLRANGCEVNWTINLTDIDDKTINGAISEYGSDATVAQLKSYTQRYTEKFLSDLRAVGVDTEKINFINVTDVIPQIQDFILQLIEKGFAYKADDGSTYFSIEKYQSKFGDYGSLVGDKFLEGKKIGARIKNDEYDKDNLSDFALWKAWDDGDAQIYWDHPQLGRGRPGWHIECSVINKVAFGGAKTDIHTGGIDLIFPHHTNEIAQSQPLGPFVDHWVHFEHLLVDGKKMAKSLKNFYILDDIEAKGFSGYDLRYLFMQTGFRQQSNFTWDALTAAKSARSKLQNNFTASDADAVPSQKLMASLNDNLNTAEALSEAHQNKSDLSIFNKVLGLGLEEYKALELPADIKELLTERQLARDNKDFALSDRLRQQIEEQGFDVKDTAQGQTITRK